MRKKYVFPALLFAAVLALSSVLLSSCISSDTGASKNPAETGTSSLQESPTASAEDPESIGNSGEIPDTSAESESETGGAIEMSFVPMETEATVRLVAVGDMLMHAGISNQAIQPDGSLNYDFLFANIREDLSEADLAVVNDDMNAVYPLTMEVLKSLCK